MCVHLLAASRARVRSSVQMEAAWPWGLWFAGETEETTEDITGNPLFHLVPPTIKMQKRLLAHGCLRFRLDSGIGAISFSTFLHQI